MCATAQEQVSEGGRQPLTTSSPTNSAAKALVAARVAQPPHGKAVDITLNTDTEHERVTIAVGPTIITGDLHDPDVRKAAAAHRLERPTTTPATPGGRQSRWVVV